MTTEEIRNGYRAFFQKHEAGVHFVRKMTELITNNHEKAEKTPEAARDYSQRAAGVREVMKHIQAITAEGGKRP